LKGKNVTIQVVGAGLYRTGTKSLKAALEVLLGRPSYHMAEVFIHPEHVATWHNAALGNMPNWHEFLKNYDATLDAPAAYFWPEISSTFPSAVVLLSVRSEESWWQSASQTVMKTEGLVSPEWDAMNNAIRDSRFSTSGQDKDSMIQGFRDHNAQVRKGVDSSHLLEWTIGDGWGPICKALDLPVPDEPFPHTNSTQEWLEREAHRNNS
jgi:hypothetical protein